jgi:sugar lactone lactonase YvrE
VVCYKQQADTRDPVRTTSPSDVTGLWRGAANRPENGLWGVMFDSWQSLSLPMVVAAAPSHWLLAGTGFHTGDVLPSLVGMESDRRWDNGAQPAGVEVILRSPVVSHFGIPDWHEATLYRASSSAYVFAAGTFEWGLGLYGDGADIRLQRLTANLLRGFGAGDPLTPLSGTAQPVSPSGSAHLETLAGTVSGYQDGPGSTAELRSPAGLALAPDHAVIVADTADRRIRRIDPGPAATVTTLAGDGEQDIDDGPGATASFGGPTGVAVDPTGVIFVVDAASHTVRRVDPGPGHTVTTVAGSPGYYGYNDGNGSVAQFNNPTGITLGPDGALYIADSDNHVIRRMATTAPYAVTTIAGTGASGGVDGPGASAQFGLPTGIAAGPDGTLYIVDTEACAVRAVAPGTARTVSTLWAGQGCKADVPQTFAGHHGIAFDASRGQVLVTDSGGYRLVALPQAGGAPQLVAGGLSLPLDVVVVDGGHLLVAETGASRVRVVTRP